MSVQNILDPVTGKIQNTYIDVAALGVVTNPLTSNLDGQTAYGLVEANVVSAGTVQVDSLEAYRTLPGAPIAVVSNLKLQTPADRIDMEKVGVNTIAVPDGSLVLTATDPATTTATAYLDQGSLRVENGINAPSIFANAGSGYNAALSASAGGQITYVQANAPSQQLALVADVASTKNIVNAVGQPLDIQTNAGDITMKPSTGDILVEALSTDTASVRVQGQGGKGGRIITDESNSTCRFEAQDGLKAVMKSSGTNARIEIDNTIGSGETVSIIADNNPSLRFQEDAGGSFTQLNWVAGTGFIETTASLGASIGAIEGSKIGCDIATGLNIVGGNTNALPFIVAHDYGTPAQDRIKFESGNVEIQGTNVVSMGLGSAPSVLADQLSSLFLVDTGSGKCGLKYESTGSPSFVQFHLESAGTPDDFIVNAAGASTGTYLRIFINGTPYKIALLAEA